MNLSCGYLDEGPHGEKVGQHGGEALSQAALGDEAKLQLRKTNGVISLLPGPAWDVQKVGLEGGKQSRFTDIQSNKIKSELYQGKHPNINDSSSLCSS